MANTLVPYFFNIYFNNILLSHVFAMGFYLNALRMFTVHARRSTHVNLSHLSRGSVWLGLYMMKLLLIQYSSYANRTVKP